MDVDVDVSARWDGEEMDWMVDWRGEEAGAVKEKVSARAGEGVLRGRDACDGRSIRCENMMLVHSTRRVLAHIACDPHTHTHTHPLTSSVSVQSAPDQATPHICVRANSVCCCDSTPSI